MSEPYVLAVFCDRCGKPDWCPEHGPGIPVRNGEDDYDYLPCSCSTKLCQCLGGGE